MDSIDKENVPNSSEVVPSSQNSPQLTSSCTQSKSSQRKLDKFDISIFRSNLILFLSRSFLSVGRR